MSDSVRPHRQQPTRFPRPWDSPGKNTGVGCHFLLQCMNGEGKGYPLQYSWASLVAQLGKNLPAMQETWVRFLDWEDPLEKGPFIFLPQGSGVDRGSCKDKKPAPGQGNPGDAWGRVR